LATFFPGPILAVLTRISAIWQHSTGDRGVTGGGGRGNTRASSVYYLRNFQSYNFVSHD
jgi:hypothetical protein